MGKLRRNFCNLAKAKVYGLLVTSFNPDQRFPFYFLFWFLFKSLQAFLKRSFSVRRRFSSASTAA